MTKVKAIIIPEGSSTLEVREFEGEIKYDDIQKTVDGLIERTFVKINNVDYVFYTNEEFLYLGMKPSLVFSGENGELKGLLAGNIFIVKDDFNQEGYTPLSDDDIFNITGYFSSRPKAVLTLKDEDHTKVIVNTYPASDLA